MEALNITETRNKLSQIVNNELSVQIGISKHKSIILPKHIFDALNGKIIALENKKRELDIEYSPLHGDPSDDFRISYNTNHGGKEITVIGIFLC